MYSGEDLRHVCDWIIVKGIKKPVEKTTIENVIQSWNLTKDFEALQKNNKQVKIGCETWGQFYKFFKIISAILQCWDKLEANSIKLSECYFTIIR